MMLATGTRSGTPEFNADCLRFAYNVAVAEGVREVRDIGSSSGSGARRGQGNRPKGGTARLHRSWAYWASSSSIFGRSEK